MTGPWSSAGPAPHDRRFPAGSNLPPARCQAEHPDGHVTCRKPVGHEPPHRCRAYEWDDDSSPSVAAEVGKAPPNAGLRLDPAPDTPDSVTDGANRPLATGGIVPRGSTVELGEGRGGHGPHPPKLPAVLAELSRPFDIRRLIDPPRLAPLLEEMVDQLAAGLRAQAAAEGRELVGPIELSIAPDVDVLNSTNDVRIVAEAWAATPDQLEALTAGGLVPRSGPPVAEPDPPEAHVTLTLPDNAVRDAFRAGAGHELLEDVPAAFRGLPPRHHAHQSPDPRRPTPSAARSGPTVLFRSVEWDGPPPLAGDIVVTTEGAYVVVDRAAGAGLGHYTIRARRARLISWTGAPPSTV